MESKNAKLELSKRMDISPSGITFYLKDEKDKSLGSGEDTNLAEVTRMILDCAQDNNVRSITSIKIIQGKTGALY